MKVEDFEMWFFANLGDMTWVRVGAHTHPHCNITPTKYSQPREKSFTNEEVSSTSLLETIVFGIV